MPLGGKVLHDQFGLDVCPDKIKDLHRSKKTRQSTAGRKKQKAVDVPVTNTVNEKSSTVTHATESHA